jgi:rare lipoprotein A
MLARWGGFLFTFTFSCFVLNVHTNADAKSAAIDKSDRSGASSTSNTSAASQMQGSVSFYGRAFAGRKTANGERFDPSGFTMAHRTLPFGTLVRVIHLKNKKSVIVRVNDRGPFTKGRVGDLSFAAAQQIGMVHHGVAQVTLSIVKKP